MTVIDVFVDRIEPDGVVVCVNGYTAAPLGTIFTSIRKTRVDATAAGFTEVEIDTAAPIALTLDEVIVFRRAMTEIPGGYSAGVRLVGEGLDVLSQFVGGKQAGEFIHLRSV